MNGEPVVCILDAGNRIVEVNDQWDRFALQNDAPDLVRAWVVGRDLLEFCAGEVTRNFVRAILQSARLRGCELVRPYRCDAPELRRYMEMVVTPHADGGLSLSHRLLRTVAMGRVMRYAVALEGRPPKLLKRCSSCNRVNPGGAWHEPDEAVADGRITYAAVLPVVYSICPDCNGGMAG